MAAGSNSANRSKVDLVPTGHGVTPVSATAVPRNLTSDVTFSTLVVRTVPADSDVATITFAGRAVQHCPEVTSSTQEVAMVAEKSFVEVQDTPAMRVARGARLLDTVSPGWWLRVDPDILDMSSSWACTLGQLYGAASPDETPFAHGMRRLGLDRDADEDVQFGFDCVIAYNAALPHLELDALWRAEIAARRSSDPRDQESDMAPVRVREPRPKSYRVDRWSPAVDWQRAERESCVDAGLV
jgi:hypothetical protein